MVDKAKSLKSHFPLFYIVPIRSNLQSVLLLHCLSVLVLCEESFCSSVLIYHLCLEWPCTLVSMFQLPHIFKSSCALLFQKSSYVPKEYFCSSVPVSQRGTRKEFVVVEPIPTCRSNNLLPGRVVRVQTDYYSYEFGLRKLEARV